MPHGTRLARPVIVLLLLALSSLACRLVSEGLSVFDAQPTATQLTAVSRQQAAVATASATPTAAAPSPLATATPPQATATAVAANGTAAATWAAPQPLPAPFDNAPLDPEQQRTSAELQQATPPVRDDVALAMAYDGVTAEMLAAHATVPAPQIGDVIPFNVLNIDSNINVPIDAQLHVASEHAYFWFDTTLPSPDSGALQEAATAFDRIYELNVSNFGPERRPGIDGDDRLHILNAAPGALCDDADFCGLLGYFSASDALPRVVNPYSNEREMFVMNGESFGTLRYVDVLTHEFRHMIEDRYDQSDADWEIEGSAMLAEDLAGFDAGPIDRGNVFLQDADQQLNRWVDSNTAPYYGQGYVLNRYIYDRLGADLYRQFATHPDDGLRAVSAVARANELPFDGLSLWLDWLVALAIHRHPQAADVYRIGDGALDTVSMPQVSAPTVLDTDVRQYAADYFLLQGDEALNFQFEGANQVPLLDTPASSGTQYWYAQRVNYSHMQLERVVDLSAVAQATLHYDVYHDIEVGYDFAYVSVSVDGGQTWQGLVASGMRGLAESDDPGDAAFTERFYTGQSNGWTRESIDLSPYAGSEIRLRFSYITDPILTFGGLALDNISIPEIGFYDDAETTVDGWQAQGFTRSTATLPQSWHLQLITFPGGQPTVISLDTESSAVVRHTLDLAQSDGEAILIVAATAPMTLEEAAYRLEIR